mgnify:CR=1 FL=1
MAKINGPIKPEVLEDIRGTLGGLDITVNTTEARAFAVGLSREYAALVSSERVPYQGEVPAASFPGFVRAVLDGEGEINCLDQRSLNLAARYDHSHGVKREDHMQPFSSDAFYGLLETKLG